MKWLFILSSCHNKKFNSYVNPFEFFSKLLAINVAFSEEWTNKLNFTAVFIFFLPTHLVLCLWAHTSVLFLSPACLFFSHSLNSWFLPPEPSFLVQDCLLPCRLPESPSCQPEILSFSFSFVLFFWLLDHTRAAHLNSNSCFKISLSW